MLLTNNLNRIKINEFIKTNEGVKAFENLQRDITNIYNGEVYTVANLPTVKLGLRAFVTDATVTTFASIVVGGGANTVPVYCDSVNWRIG
jgi:hypothetical protein